jgi:hypothetical protein
VTEQQIDLFKISDFVFKKYYKSGYQKLSVPEKVFVCVWGLEAEVNNGGFDQFYFNSTGDLAADTLDALITIGALNAGEIVREANAVFGPDGPDKDLKNRQEQLGSLGEKVHETLDELDKKFWKYPDNLESLLTSYVRENRKCFR